MGRSKIKNKKPISKPKKSAKKPSPKVDKKKPEKEYATLRAAAAHCGVSETTLKNYIYRRPDLPVFQRGAGKDGYKIDLEALDEWRKKKQSPQLATSNATGRRG